MDLSKNRGTPKWMVKIMENPNKMDDLGGTIIFGNTHIYTHPKTNQSSGSSINVDHSVFFSILWPYGDGPHPSASHITASHWATGGPDPVVSWKNPYKIGSPQVINELINPLKMA